MPPIEGVLRQVWDAYQNCRTYDDTGEVTSLNFSPQRKHGRRLPFQTAFIRPDQFRYEFYSQDNDLSDRATYIVWASGGVVQSWWSLRPQIEAFTSILNALAGPTGISDRSAYLAPSLLMSDSFESCWLQRDFGASHDDGCEDVGGVPCLRLKIVNDDPTFREHPIPAPTGEVAERLHAMGVARPTSFRTRWEWRSLWISSSDYTLRRMQDRASFDSHATESTITWNPRLDASIEAERFRFSPPTT